MNGPGRNLGGRVASLGEVDGVECVRRIGSLGEDERASQGTHHDGDDPSEHGLAEHNTVDTASTLEKSHASSGTHL